LLVLYVDVTNVHGVRDVKFVAVCVTVGN